MNELSKMPMATVEQQAAFRKAALERESELVERLEKQASDWRLIINENKIKALAVEDALGSIADGIECSPQWVVSALECHINNLRGQADD